MIGKDRLIFDPTDTTQGDNVGAFIRASDGTLITHTAVGPKKALDVNIVAGPDDPVYDEDSASANGDKLMSVGAVRQDALASSVDADGDYAWFKLNSRGALWTAPVGTVADDAADTENPVKIGSRSVSGAALLAVSSNNDRADLISDKYRRIYINDSPNIGLASVAVPVDTTAGGTAIPTTALAGRRRIMVQNLGTKDIYVGPAGVTDTSGLRVANGATLSLEIGENILLKAIAASGSQDVRVFELA